MIRSLHLIVLFTIYLFSMNTTIFAQNTAGIEPTGNREIDQLVASGEFTKAIEQIKVLAKTKDADLAWELNLKADILRRIILDFNRDEAYIKETLSKYYPNLTDKMIEDWVTKGKLEMLVIDGKKRYFRNAVWNLFRIDAAAAKVKESVDGPRDSELFDHVNDYFRDNLPDNAQPNTYKLNPAEVELTYTLTVKADAVPAGEVIRAWLPYPREDAENFSNIKLQQSSQDQFIKSPKEQIHSSIYMEKAAVSGEPTVFSYKLSYQAEDYWVLVDKKMIKDYNKNSELYKIYTAERLPHIPFSIEMKKMANSITKGIDNPYDKAMAIWNYIGENIPWTSALEYSTMPSISSYCALNGRGDCGMKAMLFITLCRISGIPAKWQSGWYMYDVERNLHDWAEIYFEGIGWIPVDPDFNRRKTGDVSKDQFFFGGRDKYRLVVNEGFGGDFYPAKTYPRSETVDFQRGEVEWKGGNLYFNEWSYRLRQKVTPLK
jgi:hypothetical protein